MKKSLIICAIALLAAAFGMSAQNLDTAKADMQKMLGVWTYTMENPMDGGNISGDVTIAKEKDAVYMSLIGIEESAIKTTAFKPMPTGCCYTDFYVEEYSFDVPMELKLVDANTIKVTIDAGGFFAEFNMIRKK